YRRAAETIASLPRDLNAVHQEGTLTDLPYIGATLAEKIDELLTTGQLEFYNRLKAEIPVGLVGMLSVPGLGPKRAFLFYKALGISTVEELQAAAETGKLQTLAGVGPRMEQSILEGIASLASRSDRMLLGEALPVANDLLARLLEIEGAQRGAIAGSLRRLTPTIGDIDLLIASDTPEPIMQT